jgi:hypothetical protein
MYYLVMFAYVGYILLHIPSFAAAFPDNLLLSILRPGRSFSILSPLSRALTNIPSPYSHRFALKFSLPHRPHSTFPRRVIWRRTTKSGETLLPLRSSPVLLRASGLGPHDMGGVGHTMIIAVIGMIGHP